MKKYVSLFLCFVLSLSFAIPVSAANFSPEMQEEQVIEIINENKYRVSVGGSSVVYTTEVDDYGVTTVTATIERVLLFFANDPYNFVAPSRFYWKNYEEALGAMFTGYLTRQGSGTPNPTGAVAFYYTAVASRSTYYNGELLNTEYPALNEEAWIGEIDNTFSEENSRAVTATVTGPFDILAEEVTQSGFNVGSSIVWTDRYANVTYSGTVQLQSKTVNRRNPNNTVDMMITYNGTLTSR